MKNLELDELREIEGGFILQILVWAATGIAYDIISNPQDSAESFASGFNYSTSKH